MSNKNFSQDAKVGVSDDGLGIGQLGSGAKSEAVQNATSISTGLASTNNFGTQITGSTLKLGSSEINNNTGTITYGLGVADVTKLLSDTTSGIGNLVKQQSDAAQKSVADVVTGLQDLALSKQTNGESTRDNTILWIVGVVIAGLVATLALFGGKRNG